MILRKHSIILLITLSSWSTHSNAQEALQPNSIESQYASVVQPLLQQYCYDCHAGALTEGEIDLGEFASVSDMRRHTDVWLKVRELIDGQQMPPNDAPQPSQDERHQLQQWVREFLTQEARAHAGDPGPTLLRRLSNAEYTYAIRDLTELETIDPTQEFPIDGAAGEGFINVGSGQGMSPALLQKYLEAAKQVAEHVMLLPDGFRFSPHTMARDQTDELLANIQAFYRRFTADGGGTAVDLQGIKFETNQGGLLPVAKYLTATLENRDDLLSGRTSIEQVAQARGLNTRYLTTLWKQLSAESGSGPSFLIDDLREQWQSTTAEDVAELETRIQAFQNALWKFNAIGHIGREGGPTCWMEPVSPVVVEHALRLALPPPAASDEVRVYLSAINVRDRSAPASLVLRQPRIEFKPSDTGVSHPAVLLREVQSLSARVKQLIARELPRTREYLRAISKQLESEQTLDSLANAERLNLRMLQSWSELVGVVDASPTKIAGHFTQRLEKVQGYEAINGWGSLATPSLLTNNSDQPINLQTLTIPPLSVVVHPSPTQNATIAWQSPITGEVRIEGLVADADPNCGNGVTWQIELRSRGQTSVLSTGTLDNQQSQNWQLESSVKISAGDVITLAINARDNEHTCDTTQVAIVASEVAGQSRVWDLAHDIVADVLISNPHRDGYGNSDVWHFYPADAKPSNESAIPPESVLAQWLAAVKGRAAADQIDGLALRVEKLLTESATEGMPQADAELRTRLLDWMGPLKWIAVAEIDSATVDSQVGNDASRFGITPNGTSLGDGDLGWLAEEALEIRLPAELAYRGEFVTTALLPEEHSESQWIQVQAAIAPPTKSSLSATSPILVSPGDEARQAVEQAMHDYRELFPPALCYSRIVPVDEVVTLSLFYREDQHLKRLMLDDQQAAELDRLWNELAYVSQEPLKLAVSIEQLLEFLSQDAQQLIPAFEAARGPINQRAEAFRQLLIDTQPAHVAAVLAFAERAWRRPVTDDERQTLCGMVAQLQAEEIPHAQAIQLTLARVLTSPAFLYKLEQPSAGTESTMVNSHDLATRLSFFLWSSLPDAELRTAADNLQLQESDQILKQTHRMLRDPRVRRLAIQFACQWLHVRDFDQNDDKNEQLYPEFASLRGDAYEETISFFSDMFRNNGSILDTLAAEHAFLNENLAKHYGIDWNSSGQAWQRVEGVQKAGRGGILGMATFLASQSGASRTSPILRGNWVYETLLGERLPRPPAGVPQLPEELPQGLTARQLIELHSGNPACAKCHVRIDPYGFALEQFDAIGRHRPQAVDTRTTLYGGRDIEGIAGLKDYLVNERRDDFVRQFCRKLLGFALGREVQLSDEPLIEEMQNTLQANDFRFQSAVDCVVTSPQFRTIRGLESTRD